MTLHPILAEDISPIVLVFFLGPVLLALLAMRIIAASRRTGRPTGLPGRLVLVLLSGFFLFVLLTVRGGAPSSFIAVAALSLVAGLLSLYQWWRKSREPARTVENDIPPPSPSRRAQLKLSVMLMVMAWLFIFGLLDSYWEHRSSWTWGTWILVSVLTLCLVLIPVLIIRYIRSKQR